MRYLILSLLFVTHLCLATPCPSLEFVQNIKFTSTVKIYNGSLNAGANFDGIKDTEHQGTIWQFVFAPIFSEDVEEANAGVKFLDEQDSAEAFVSIRQNIAMEECSYRNRSRRIELHAFHCGEDLCFDASK